MGDALDFFRNYAAVEKAGQERGLDPRLVALVQYLARRAAEADYRAETARDSQPRILINEQSESP